MNIFIFSLIFITLINVAAYVWAYRQQSDRLTDLTYSLCFVLITIYCLVILPSISPAAWVLALMILAWAVRLGGFLFYRIHQMGKDNRFDAFRASPAGFLKFWLLQSVSIWILSWPIIFGLSQSSALTIHIPATILFLIGLVLESVSDWQKFQFKRKYGTMGILQTGMFRVIRHPNYLGEILIWISIFWYVFPILQGWHWIAISSPMWIIILLIGISGIPLIEKSNREKYKGNVVYNTYFQRSWRLIPYVY